MLKTEALCGDSGRTMFFEYVGRYFATTPKLKPLPAGAVCPICGSTSAQLWQTNTGQAQCLAQNTITRKRAGRRTAEEPCVPASDPAGKVSFADGSMVVSGPFVARVVTRVLPDIPLPEMVTVQFPEKGGISRFISDLLTDPPPPPFAAIVFGKKAVFRSSVTVDPSLIKIGGPEGFDIPRPIMRVWLSLFEGMKGNAISKALALRARFAHGEISDSDREALADLLRLHPEFKSSFRKLPSPGTPTAAVFQRILVS
jgi:hypothetical protein